MTRALGVGIVGCGNVAANFHVPAYLARAADIRVVAAADPVPERREAVAGAAGIPADRTLPTTTFRPSCRGRHRRHLRAPAVPRGRRDRRGRGRQARPVREADRDHPRSGRRHARRWRLVPAPTFAMMYNYLWFPPTAAAKPAHRGRRDRRRPARDRELPSASPTSPARVAPERVAVLDPAASGGGVLMDRPRCRLGRGTAPRPARAPCLGAPVGHRRPSPDRIPGTVPDGGGRPVAL